MSLLRLNALSIGFGGQSLLSAVDLAIDTRQRIALVGRNGSGKSTLLKLINGEIAADSGEIVRRQGLKVAYLQQDVPQDLMGSVYAIVACGLPEIGHWLAEFHTESRRLGEGQGDTSKLSDIQSQLDANDGWQSGQQVSATLSRMQLDPDAEFASLSGGMKRRVLLARALQGAPDILLLDEPTNHLDIPAIEWLEEHLSGLRCTLMFVTHDRAFLRRLASRIIELDRGRLTDWPANYDGYLRDKAIQLEIEDKQNALFDKKLAQEEVWIRQGIKARRTRNEGRVRALQNLRKERRARINVMASANLQVNTAGKSGKLVLEATDLEFAFVTGEPALVRNFSTTIMRGDKIGVIGPNGIGKSTLIKLLLGELAPQSGSVRLGTNLDIAYFDQLRTGLNKDLSAMDNVSEGRDMIEFNGETRHIIGYMQDFLFPPDRARAPITALSGGETNRLMLAKLFLKPSNLLVLDEPTNDLDVETLELLENLVADYPGTVIIISHDRAFLDNTVTSTLIFEQPGVIREYIGGYTDWMHQRGRQDNPAVKAGRQKKIPATENPTQAAKATQSAKLSYKNQRELDQLPTTIEALEIRLGELESSMGQADFYATGNDTEAVINAAAEVAESLQTAFDRWAELEEKTRPSG